MPTISGSPYLIDPSRLRPLDPTLARRADPPEGGVRAFTFIPNDPPDIAPGNLYAEVKVGDQVMAKIYNGGSVEMLNGADAPDLARQGTGPQLAQARAEQIAQALKGTIVRADTAQTQEQWVPVHALHHYLADVTVVQTALEALDGLAPEAQRSR